MSAPKPANDAKRVEALRRYRLLDTEPEQVFNDSVEIASAICETPIAAISLVDQDRQWFKARVGLDAFETPRDFAFCGYTILDNKTFVVEDATQDERFANNPLVTGAPDIRFYAGSPLIDRDGYALGSLCVIDRKPRPLLPHQQRALEALARQIIAQLEYRATAAELAEALEEVETLRTLLPICSHCKGIRNDAGYWHTVEDYLSEHTSADLSHGICPACFQQHYPEIYAKNKDRLNSFR